MNKKPIPQEFPKNHTVITAGSAYLDIDAYACCIALRELLERQGKSAVACSRAPLNYSVCKSLIREGQLLACVPRDWPAENLQYIIVDVSDPEYIGDSVPLDRIAAVYDHHAGFEDYWRSRIGGGAHIEFIGAAATLIYREWKKAGLEKEMTRATALLLIAAILDNTLNLTSANTTEADVEALGELLKKEQLDSRWCADYFSEVQTSVESDLKNALFHDIKIFHGENLLPAHIAQLCLWDAERILEKLPQIRQWFRHLDSWMINFIDIRRRCSYFVCDDPFHQKQLSERFGVEFSSGVARSEIPYLRKEIIKKTYFTR